jgi:hypothetical protein
MNLTLASGNHAYTRTQALILLCLMVVAFEIGMRMAEKKDIEKKATIVQTTIVETNYWKAREERRIVETVPPQLVTNAPTVASVVRPVKPLPKTNTYIAPVSGSPKIWVQPKPLKADGPITKHKTIFTDPHLQYPLSPPPGSPQNPGIRIALP